jgi:hypothetical protein
VVEPVETTTELRFLITHRGLITNSLSPVAAFGVAPIPNAVENPPSSQKFAQNAYKIKFLAILYAHF